MTDTTQAAERLRRNAAGESICNVWGVDRPYDAQRADYRTLAEAYLAEHQADDGELISVEWVTETYGKRDGAFGNWPIGSLELVCCFGWHLSRANPMVTINYITTRGQLRRLIEVLR